MTKPAAKPAAPPRGKDRVAKQRAKRAWERAAEVSRDQGGSAALRRLIESGALSPADLQAVLGPRPAQEPSQHQPQPSSPPPGAPAPSPSSGPAAAGRPPPASPPVSGTPSAPVKAPSSSQPAADPEVLPPADADDPTLREGEAPPSLGELLKKMHPERAARVLIRSADSGLTALHPALALQPDDREALEPVAALVLARWAESQLDQEALTPEQLLGGMLLMLYGPRALAAGTDWWDKRGRAWWERRKAAREPAP